MYSRLGPDLVDAWVSILQALPESQLVLYPFNPNWAAQYPQRTSFVRFLRSQLASADVNPDRVHFLDAQPARAPILGLLNMADVYLDSFPYSGAVSVIEPLICGCPPVVMQGQTARCRQSAALLREIGLDVLVTNKRDDYVAVAVRMARDEALRSEMSQAVKEMAQRAGLGLSDSIGRQVGDALRQAFASRLVEHA